MKLIIVYAKISPVFTSLNIAIFIILESSLDHHIAPDYITL